ncbi:MAG: hypothetical protein KGY66_03830 [Candidatus Thermoplasmatota archaeon]|nr:hypothetical protein [Candidatus Thermoplasmatota archaeon]MBS3790027.1 hypothetical protein [Candidatus Thermoplasmatota archaeon]
MALAETISNNFLPIFYSLIVIVVLIIIAKVLLTREKAQERKELADYRLKHKKLDIQRKQKHLDKLKEASMVLKDDEKEKIDEIERDKAVLSRRSLAMMNEIEERMQRLERGADNAKLMKTLKKVNRAERELFGEEER